MTLFNFGLTPHEAAVAIGSALKRHRIAQNITQLELAARSGVSPATLKRIENAGKGSLEDVMLLAWVLGLEAAFTGFIPDPMPSSIDELAKLEAAGKAAHRRRASRPRRVKSIRPARQA